MLQNTEKQPNTPLSLGLRNTWLPWGSGGLPRLGEYEHWVCYGAGGWADADIHLGDMLGSFLDRFGIILEYVFNSVGIVLLKVLGQFWNRLGILKNHPGGLEMLQNTAK